MATDLSIDIEEQIFFSKDESFNIDYIISSHRSNLISKIEGLPEDNLETTAIKMSEIVSGCKIFPAVIDLKNTTCHKVRISTSSNTIISVIRIDMLYEGDGNSFKWKIPDTFSGSDIYENSSDIYENTLDGLKVFWSIIPSKNIFMIYTPLVDGISKTEILENAKQTGYEINRISRILGHMKNKANNWNDSIIPLANEYLNKRRKEVIEREKFLSEFKNYVDSVLLN